jgi:hypothetical protein
MFIIIAPEAPKIPPEPAKPFGETEAPKVSQQCPSSEFKRVPVLLNLPIRMVRFCSESYPQVGFHHLFGKSYTAEKWVV